MMTFIIVVHVIVCAGLITIVLIQRGRGGGLVESFAGVESMFGTKTSLFLTRTTTVLSIIFFITCLSLAVLSVKSNRSLMEERRKQAQETKEDIAVTSVVEPEKADSLDSSVQETTVPEPKELMPNDDSKGTEKAE